MSEQVPQKPADMVNVVIDGQQVRVPKGTNVIEAAKSLGYRYSALLLPPAPLHRWKLPHVPGASEGAAKDDDRV